MKPTGKPAATLLLVDDTPHNLSLMAELLKGQYKIKVATNGGDALRIAAGTPPPDLILLDIMMAGLDGYQVCEKLKADPATRDIPVIFLTAKIREEDEAKGFAVGAVDYITKPISAPIVKARIHTQLALRDAQRKLERQNRALLDERELVENIITRMRASEYFNHRYLRYLVASVDRTTGDILLACFTPDGRQWVLVGDFTGHGLPAAVGAPLIAHVFYGYARAGQAIETALEEINGVLYRQLPAQVFMAACLIELDARREQLSLWNAGMPHCLLMGPEVEPRRLASQNPPLGICSTIDQEQGRERLAARPGSRLYVFSDGIPETAGTDGQAFGYDRTEAFLARLLAGETEPQALLAQLQAFHGGNQFDDDITLVEIQV
jgi:CheY-like chemotaxis protein